MSRTYKATGINLKSMPMGESDRLLTILTREFGLIRAVAMGARKHNSSLGGRSGLFVVNQLLIAKGRSLDKIAQAETLESYPGLSHDLTKLTASQYLAEISLYQALSDQPQEELFCLLNEHLQRLATASPGLVLPHLTHAIFQLLVLAGIAPQVHLCCVSRQPLIPNFDCPDWRSGFSTPAGGTVTLEVLDTLRINKPKPSVSGRSASGTASLGDRTTSAPKRVTEAVASYRAGSQGLAALHLQITASELDLLQQLAQAELPHIVEPGVHKDVPSIKVWSSVERILRHYAQYHFDRPIRSASLIDACLLPTVP